MPSEHVAGDKDLVGTWQSWDSEHPGGEREEVQGGSCWEGRQCQKTVETLLAVERIVWEGGWKARCDSRDVNAVVCSSWLCYLLSACKKRVQGQAVCHHPRAVSYPSL